MAQIITADELAVGDVYRSFSGLGVLRADAYQVRAIRTVKSVETYRVIDAINVRSGLGAGIDLRHDVKVAKLSPVDWRDLRTNIETMPDGEQVNVVRHDGQFWI